MDIKTLFLSKSTCLFQINNTKMKLLFGLLLLLCSFTVTAQDSLSITLKQQMLKEWQRAKVYTQQYLEAMPADKYGFHPVDSVRTFAQQMLHLAQANAGLVSIGTGYRSPAAQVFYNPNFEKTPTIQNKDSVVYYVNKSYDVAIDAIKNLDFTKITEVISWNMPGGKRTTTRLGWLMKAFEHQTHHRGQCTVYFRVAGLHPPGELLWDQ